MNLIDFDKNCKDCCDSKTRVEACSNGSPVVIYLNESTGVPVVTYILLGTGVVTTTAPPNLLIGNCTEIANSSSTAEVIQGAGSPIVGSIAPIDSKLYYDTTTQNITRANIGGFWVELSNQKLQVLTAIQPTPLTTGNTSNLNSTFKDSTGNTWIVDSEGNAIQAGSVITLDGNNYNIVRTNTTANVSPTSVEAASPINGDTGTVFLSDNKIEYWFYNGTNWVLAKTVNPTVLDGNDNHVVRANTVTGVAPTVSEIPTQTLGDTAKVLLSNNTTEYWSYNGTTWILDKTVEAGGAKKFRIVQNLAAGNNTINHNLALGLTPVIVEVRDNTTGAIITHRVVTENTNSTVINVTAAVTNARITIIG